MMTCRRYVLCAFDFEYNIFDKADVQAPLSVDTRFR